MKSLLIVLVFCCLLTLALSSRKNVCYWGTWSTYRTGDAHFTIEDIDPRMCTHFVYSFLGATEDGEVIHLDPWADLGLNYINRFVGLRMQSPTTKFMFSVGGYSFGSEIFSRLASTAATRARFAQSVLAKINEFGFDGFDLDWEWPGQRNGSDPINDRENFVLLCAEIHRVLSPAGKEFGIAVAATEFSASISYDVPRVHPNVDFINLMTYDLHGSWNDFTGIHAAMYAGPADTTAWARQFNVHASVTWWRSQGAPVSKLVLGMPAYGRSFTLASAAQNGVGASAVSGGNPGPLLGEHGFLGYNEICQLLRSGWTRQWQPQQMVPFAFSGNQWVGYDDLESVRYKLQYIINNNLAGSMWWSIETEDFRNRCGNGHSPLIRLATQMMMT